MNRKINGAVILITLVMLASTVATPVLAQSDGFSLEPLGGDANPDTGTQNDEFCGDGVRWREVPQVGNTTDREPVKNDPWIVPCFGYNRIMNFWSNQFETGQGEFKLPLAPDQHLVIYGGGSMWSWKNQPDQQATAEAQFAENPNTSIELSQLCAYIVEAVPPVAGCETIAGPPQGSTVFSTDTSPEEEFVPVDQPNAEVPVQPAAEAPGAPLQSGCQEKDLGPDDEIVRRPHGSVVFIHRLEEGGGDPMHSEFYPHPGVQTISYYLPADREDRRFPWIWWGVGHRWQFVFCEDPIDQLANYARNHFNGVLNRLDDGHSGLVMDVETCTLYDTVWPDLNQGQRRDRRNTINGILREHRANQDTVPCRRLSGADVVPYRADGASGPIDFSPAVTCANLGNDNFASNFEGREIWRISTGNRLGVLNVWSNWISPNFRFTKTLLPPGTNLRIKGGGDITYWHPDCEDAAQRGMRDLAQDQRVLSLSELKQALRRAGLLAN